MLHLTSLDEALPVFSALGSKLRVELVKILLEDGPMNMNELAARLQITNGALTSHIKKLEACGIVTIDGDAGAHGNEKVCSVRLDGLLVEWKTARMQEQNVCSAEVRVGHYTDYEISPTCGLASSSSLIGEVDDPRYFAHDDRYQADLLWLTKGYVEYILPNFVPAAGRIEQIAVTAELGSESPGHNNDWPSDIHFSLNHVPLGVWTSPGDFGDVRGALTPDWWYPNWNQYGLLKSVVINREGTFIDGLRISDTNTAELALTGRSVLRFRFEVPEDAAHVGGLTIYGRSFGNYAQDIGVRITYSLPGETE
ncbi:MAG: winged helix-turn-helix transcriptional regulator [Eubacteriales bacterium]|nr:winged helix-turn-helix transcriptional regulator [Eubacteriales bacterium]